MPDVTLPPTKVRKYRVIVTLPDGSRVPIPSGDTLSVKTTVASGNDALDAVIGAMADGGVAVVFTPKRGAEPNISVVIADAQGLFTPGTISVEIAGGIVQQFGTLGLDLVNPEETDQALPPNGGAVQVSPGAVLVDPRAAATAGLPGVPMTPAGEPLAPH